MPFLIVQLPKFGIDAIEDGGWPLIREQEWRVADELEHVAAVVTLDAGESNDLHPHDKKTIAESCIQCRDGFCVWPAGSASAGC